MGIKPSGNRKSLKLCGINTLQGIVKRFLVYFAADIWLQRKIDAVCLRV